jgi:hypothetical protein
MVIKNFNDFVNESEQDEEIRKALDLLKNSGYDIKKIAGKKLKFPAPELEDLLKIPEFKRIHDKFKFRVHEITDKIPEYHKSNIKIRSLILYSEIIEDEDGPLCLGFRPSDRDRDHITVCVNKGINPDYFSLDANGGNMIMREVQFGTPKEKKSVMEDIEKYLYCAAINMGIDRSKSIINGVVDSIGLIANPYSKSINNKLTHEALTKVVGMINEINPRRFALTLEKIPDNKAMDLITAVLDNPKISTEMMKYLEANPEAFDNPAKIIRRYKSK